MAQRADGESLSKFLQDRELLVHNDAAIARRMGMDRSNFSSYINGHLPITRAFLRRFYSAFGSELEMKGKGVLDGDRIDMMEGRLGDMEERLNALMEEVRRLRG